MMIIVNFGFFSTSSVGGVLYHINDEGQDWYNIRPALTSWEPMTGAFVDAVFGAWASVREDGTIWYVTDDPSRLVPDNSYVIGIDGDVSDIEAGMLWDKEANILLPKPPEAPYVPREISDRQFFQTLANRGLITKQEALAAVKVGELPPAMLALIGQILDEDAAFAVEMAISGATIFERNHPDTELLAYLYGWDDAALDDIWIEAGNLK